MILKFANLNRSITTHLEKNSDLIKRKCIFKQSTSFNEKSNFSEQEKLCSSIRFVDTKNSILQYDDV